MTPKSLSASSSPAYAGGGANGGIYNGIDVSGLQVDISQRRYEKVEGDCKQHVHNQSTNAQGCAIKVTCPECGQEIETFVENLYWSKID